MRDLPIFLHIPKTAGTTLLDAIHHNLPMDNIWAVYGQHVIEPEMCLPSDWSKIHLVRGHFVYGIHKWLPQDCGYWYFTLLRNPVDRVVSLWRYIKRNTTHPLRAAVLPMTLVDFVTSGVYANATNGMTMMLSGLHGEIPVLPYATLPSQVSQTSLQHAIDNLRTFKFVGPCEQFGYCIDRIGQLLGWRNYKYTNMNIAPGRYTPTLQERQLVEKYNQYDLEIYRRVVEDRL